MFVYEVTIEFKTALFARSRVTSLVTSMDAVNRLRLGGERDGYTFVSYRGPLPCVNEAGVLAAMKQEQAAQKATAEGRADMRAVFANGDNTHRFPK